jgi:hypothetical protein
VAKTPSREYRIYLAIWRKALRDSSDPSLPLVTVNASSFSIALAMRQGMYRAIRPYREGEIIDRELAEASDKFVLSVIKQDDGAKIHTITVKPRSTLSDLERELLALGIDEADLSTTEEATAKKMMESIMAPEADVPELPRKSTPFYTRES